VGIEQDIVISPALEAVQSFPQPVDDDSWLIEADGLEPDREQEYESWFTVANGRTGTRGSLEQVSLHSAPATYVAGVYAWPEGEPYGPEMISGPEWVRMELQVGGERVGLDRGNVLELRRVLDLRNGILFHTWRHRLPSGNGMTFRSARFASMADRAIMVLMAELESGQPTRLKMDVPLHYTRLFERAEMRQLNGWVKVSLQGRKGGCASFAISTEATDESVERIVAVDRGTGEMDLDQALDAARSRGAGKLMEEHCEAWSKRWEDSGIVVSGDFAMQRALRFAIYHLISSGDPESDLASIGARGLTGPGYRGHVFWDTEAFVLPFFIYTHPPTARALLAYRYRRLPAARRKAAEFGYRGALYPWESADTGEEVTPPHVWLNDGTRVPVLTGLQQHHISADVAWATYHYWQATGDDAFLAEMGAEILLETARFWASRVSLGPDGRYHIHGVMGPDEYHENVSDNAFTNVLARWNLQRAIEVLSRLHELDAAASMQLAARVDLQEQELLHWRAVTKGLVDGFDPRTQLYEQFAGFFDLEGLRAVDVASRPFSGEREIGLKRLRHTQVIKQPDVIMLANMLPEAFPLDVAAANYRYYEPRASHGSSLSPAIHASVAARINNLEEALKYFRMAASVDLDDRMGNAADGVHLATMGGLWQAAVMGLGGLRAERDGLHIDPHLPYGWDRLAFPIQWRGARLEVEAEHQTLTVGLDARARVAMAGRQMRWLGPGRYQARREGNSWSGLQKIGSMTTMLSSR
jgi:trehalose/maltose hydrolase-like predicted phosphorylase